MRFTEQVSWLPYFGFRLIGDACWPTVRRIGLSPAHVAS